MTGSSRVRVLGVTALAAVLVASAALTGPAQAAEKKGKKGPDRALVTRTNVPIPDATIAGFASRVDVPLNVGKAFKGKSAGVVEFTYQTTGSAADAADDLSIRLTSPSGRSIFVPTPAAPAGLVSIGPLTLTPNSAIGLCSTLPTVPCADSNDTLGPPYAGRIGDATLALFFGDRMRGRWTVTAYDGSVGVTSVLTRATLSISPARPIQ